MATCISTLGGPIRIQKGRNIMRKQCVGMEEGIAPTTRRAETAPLVTVLLPSAPGPSATITAQIKAQDWVHREYESIVLQAGS
eukprot:1111052-Prorocentrum_lima.AAC.1